VNIRLFVCCRVREAEASYGANGANDAEKMDPCPVAPRTPQFRTHFRQIKMIGPVGIWIAKRTHRVQHSIAGWQCKDLFALTSRRDMCWSYSRPVRVLGGPMFIRSCGSRRSSHSAFGQWASAGAQPMVMKPDIDAIHETDQREAAAGWADGPETRAAVVARNCRCSRCF